MMDALDQERSERTEEERESTEKKRDRLRRCKNIEQDCSLNHIEVNEDTERGDHLKANQIAMIYVTRLDQ